MSISFVELSHDKHQCKMCRIWSTFTICHLHQICYTHDTSNNSIALFLLSTLLFAANVTIITFPINVAEVAIITSEIIFLLPKKCHACLLEIQHWNSCLHLWWVLNFIDVYSSFYYDCWNFCLKLTGKDAWLNVAQISKGQ